MTTKQLENRYLGHTFLGKGHYRIGFDIRGINRYCTTTNTMAIDRIDDELPERDYDRIYVTQKQALRALYDEVKRKNDIR